jgi:hypothetical protein
MLSLGISVVVRIMINVVTRPVVMQILLCDLLTYELIKLVKLHSLGLVYARRILLVHYARAILDSK